MDSEKADRGGHRDRVLQLFVEHNVMLSSYLYMMAEDWHIVEESLQETAVYMGSNAGEYTLGTNFGAWARAVARNRCRELLRQKRRVASREKPLREDVCSLIPEGLWNEAGDFDAAHKQALSKCLQKLPHGHRRLVDMRYTQGRRCREIAARFGKTVESIYMTLSRVRYQLKQCIERHLAPGEI